MKGNVRSKFREKARRLLKFYSLWQETRQGHFEQQYLKILGEILAVHVPYGINDDERSDESYDKKHDG